MFESSLTVDPGSQHHTNEYQSIHSFDS